GTPRPPRRHLRWRTRERSPPRTAVGAHVVPPVDGPATASLDDRHDQLPDACLLPSQPLTAKVLRRPVESAQYTSFAFGRRLAASELVASMGTVGDALDNAVAQ